MTRPTTKRDANRRVAPGTAGAHILALAALLVCAACSGATDDPTYDRGVGRLDRGGTQPPDTGHVTPDRGNQPTPDARAQPDRGKATDGATVLALVINEVAAAGDPDDWFELFNGTAADINLSGHSFTDDINGKANLTTFKSGTVLKANGYLQVTLTDTWPGFKLGKDEELGLFDATGQLIDSVDWKEGDSPAKKSYGRIPDGTGAFATLETPTPGAKNKGK